MKFVPGLFLFITLSFSAAAQESWRVSGQTQPVSLGHRACQIKKDITGPDECTLNLVFFDSVYCTLQVLDQPDESAAVHLNRAMEYSGIRAIAGCNGGYFTPEFKPLGLVISGMQRSGRFEKSSLLGGLIQVRKNRPVMLWRDEFVEVDGITDLVQAGPRLVNGGLPVKGLDAVKKRPRTFLLTDNNGKWAMGISSNVSLRTLSDLLSARGIITELDVERALNMDGGSSTGLWWRSENGQESYKREFSIVRNFLVVVPRK